MTLCFVASGKPRVRAVGRFRTLHLLNSEATTNGSFRNTEAEIKEGASRRRPQTETVPTASEGGDEEVQFSRFQRFARALTQRYARRSI